MLFWYQKQLLVFISIFCITWLGPSYALHFILVTFEGGRALELAGLLVPDGHSSVKAGGRLDIGYSELFELPLSWIQRKNKLEINLRKTSFCFTFSTDE